MTKIQKRIATGVACLVVVAVGAASIGATSGSKQAVAPEETDSRILVDVGSPEIGDIVIQSEYVGTVDPNQQVTVYPKAAGEVLAVHKSVGDEVKAGDVLLEIDSKALRTSIAQSEAAIGSAQAKVNYNLAMAEKDLETHEFNVEKGYDSSLIQAEAAVKAAENGVETAYSNLSTIRKKLNDARTDQSNYFEGYVGSYSLEIEQLEQQVALAELQVEAAQLGLEQAEDTYRSVKMLTKEQGVKVEDAVEVARLNADLSDQQIALQKLRDDLAEYTVKASISGVIEQRNVDPYDMASSQSPVFVISNKEGMSVTFNVAEATLEHMRIGDAVTIEKNGTTCEGTISEISTMVDAKSGLFTVKASVAEAPASFYSGSTVKVYSDAQKAEDDLMIPIDAVYYEKGEPFVYLAVDGMAVKTYIETGISDEQNIQVISGLSANDQIITTWNAGLADGVEIALVAGGNDTSSSDDAEEE